VVRRLAARRRDAQLLVSVFNVGYRTTATALSGTGLRGTAYPMAMRSSRPRAHTQKISMPREMPTVQPRRRPDDTHNRPVRATTPPHKRMSGEEIQLRFPDAVLAAQGETQTLLQPPELPRQRRTPRRTGSAAGRDPVVVPAHTPSMTISGAAARGPVVLPATYQVGGEQKVDKVSELFTSLETMQQVRQTALRRIFGYIIHPQSPRKRMWDLFVLLLVVFSTLYESYNAAFRPMHTVTLWWELVIDL